MKRINSYEYTVAWMKLRQIMMSKIQETINNKFKEEWLKKKK